MVDLKEEWEKHKASKFKVVLNNPSLENEINTNFKFKNDVLGLVQSSTSNKVELLNNNQTLCSESSIEHFELLNKRKELLDSYKLKQPFRVSVGKSDWVNYETFNPSYNLREILKDEIVIEFDTDDKNISAEGINFTGINLYKAGITFEIWSHNGKSPHLHIKELPIGDLSSENLRLFKKVFIRKYVPLEYLDCVDFSLTGIHLVAIEWCKHWKGCYDVKELLYTFNPKEDSNAN